MTVRHFSLYITTAILSFAAGWHTNSEEAALASANPLPAAPRPVIATSPVATASTAASAGPLIAVTDDGIATLRVEQQPLEWVLEEIAKQSGWTDVKQRASATPSAVASVPPAPEPTNCSEALPPEKVARLLQTIEQGSEDDRHDGLLQARSDGVTVPDETLKRLFETDGSERVRLLAFETYLERLSGSTDAMRSALEAALYLPSAAIQREAKQRLDSQIDSLLNAGSSEQTAEP